MTRTDPLSKREREVAQLLMQGNSNKQIALALEIAERTVEFHLKNIYAKLSVDSRLEATLKLRESTGNLGHSTVEKAAEINNIVSNQTEPDGKNQKILGVTRKISLEDMIRFLATYKVPVFIWILLIVFLIFMFSNRTPWSFTREGEYPDEATVGLVLQRSNASGETVHGQFGTVAAWPAQPGYVKYDNIKTPRADHLFLKLRYSKYSSSTVPILVYLDSELSPRATILPVDQGGWDKFIWTDSIDLGSVKRGVHSIKLFTDGQVYGVADLDLFILTVEPP